MDEALEEAMQAISTVREKVIAILNSITFDLLPFSLNPSNLQVGRLTLSLSGGAATDMSKRHISGCRDY